jgi:hypothetical protein
VSETSTTSKAEWAAAGVHTVTLPSGSRVKIRIPNLAQMAQAGELDNELLQYAIPDRAVEETEKELSPEEKKANLTKLANFHAWLVSHTLVDPALTPEEVPSVVPTPDLEVIVELASRRRDMDVVGHHIGGLEVSADFRRFRGIADGESDFLDA